MEKHSESADIEDYGAKIAQLSEQILQKDRFLATVSHEIRSPMNGVFGMADALSRTSLDQKQARYLSVLRDACDAMLAIANQLLEKSKLDSGQTTLIPVDFDIAEFVSGQISEFSEQLRTRDLLLELDTKILIDSRIRFDKFRLGQVLSNLISNAIRYTDEGRIVVRVILQIGNDGKRHLILSVEDSGIGIPPDKHAVIFEPFGTADPEQSVQRGGTGLGLAVVRDIVSLMGGNIRVDSTPGLGSTFSVDLVVEAAESNATAEPAARLSMPQNLDVLLAEDNDANAFVFEVLLEDTGVKTTRVRNGHEAVVAHAKGCFDVIFMDIQMPVLNGIQATTAIREMEKVLRDQTPIIALSADTTAVQYPEYQAAGFTDMISKPMRQKDLLDMLAVFDKDSG